MSHTNISIKEALRYAGAHAVRAGNITICIPFLREILAFMSKLENYLTIKNLIYSCCLICAGTMRDDYWDDI